MRKDSLTAIEDAVFYALGPPSRPPSAQVCGLVLAKLLALEAITRGLHAEAMQREPLLPFPAGAHGDDK